MKYIVEEEVLNKILNTLAAMPYAQVAEAISELQGGVTPFEEEEECSSSQSE